jgi:hypothetical protein
MSKSFINDNLIYTNNDSVIGVSIAFGSLMILTLGYTLGFLVDINNGIPVILCMLLFGALFKFKPELKYNCKEVSDLLCWAHEYEKTFSDKLIDSSILNKIIYKIKKQCVGQNIEINEYDLSFVKYMSEWQELCDEYERLTGKKYGNEEQIVFKEDLIGFATLLEEFNIAFKHYSNAQLAALHNDLLHRKSVYHNVMTIWEIIKDCKLPDYHLMKYILTPNEYDEMKKSFIGLNNIKDYFKTNVYYVEQLLQNMQLHETVCLMRDFINKNSEYINKETLANLSVLDEDKLNFKETLEIYVDAVEQVESKM